MTSKWNYNTGRKWRYSTRTSHKMRWRGSNIECEGWRQHSSLIFLILLFTKPNIKVSDWLYQTKTHFTQILYQPFSRVSPPSFTLYENETGYFYVADRLINGHLSQVGGTSAQLYFWKYMIPYNKNCYLVRNTGWARSETLENYLSFF